MSPQPSGEDKAATEWRRCFICGEIFTDEAAAHQHFGQDAGSPLGAGATSLLPFPDGAKIQKHHAVGSRSYGNVYEQILTATWAQVIGKIRTSEYR